MSELKPCPFCGGEAQLMETKIGSNWWIVTCKHYEDCPVNPVGRNAYAAEIDAIDAWNTRAERTCEQVDVTEMHKPFTTYMTECSECGGVLAVDEMPAPNYCPNCGAKVVES